MVCVWMSQMRDGASGIPVIVQYCYRGVGGMPEVCTVRSGCKCTWVNDAEVDHRVATGSHGRVHHYDGTLMW